MGSGLLGVSMSGMQAAQFGLQVTSHNIANANTPGYSRQTMTQATAVPLYTGNGFVGRGSVVTTVQRQMDEVLNRQANRTQALVSELDALSAQITQIDNLMADSSAGLSPVLQEFFRGVNEVSSNPSSMAARQSMVSTAQSLVARFQSLETRMSDQYESVNTQLISNVDLINGYANSIAEINKNLAQTEGAVNQPANDLRDQRDQLVAELNKLVSVTAVVQDGNNMNVYIGNGQELVVGTLANELSVVASSSDSSRLTVALPLSTTATLELQENQITGGALGGLLKYRREALDLAANSLGQIAASVTLAFNAQHALGQDLVGNKAGTSGFISDFFEIGKPQALANGNNKGIFNISVSFAQPSISSNYTLQYSLATGYTLTNQGGDKSWTQPTLAALQSAVSAAEGFNLDLSNVPPATSGITVNGPGVADANFYTRLTSSDYQLTFANGSFSVKRLSDGALFNPSSPTATTLLVDGLQIDVGSLANAVSGDSFLIQPTRSVARNMAVNAAASADVRLLAAAAPVRGRNGALAGNTNTGSATIDVTRVGPNLVQSTFATGLELTHSINAGTGARSLAGFATGSSITVSNTTSAKTYVGAPALSVPFSAGDTITVDGVSFKIVGDAKNGDKFSLQASIGATGDGANMLRLGALQSQQTMIDKKGSFQSVYAAMVSSIGVQTNSAKVNLEAQTSMLDQIVASRESVRGVNLDEEAAQMLRFQQAYQASAKVFDIASRLFDILFQLG